ncbi:MAG: 50S ribosomal protein L19 [Spirochaetes bacterium DG_61]|jgi:large subunit ribosomal protein L19|nr:MAG: 50S ribosomal protein L19 [Spirochaetes bacterium DG_61]
MNLVNEVEKNYIKYDEIPFKPGDLVRVHVKIVEGKRERIQVFEGYVIGIKNSGNRKTFRVRRESYGIGVERVFPLNSPRIEKIEVVRRGKVRRAKLYYLRERVGKAAQVKQKL